MSEAEKYAAVHGRIWNDVFDALRRYHMSNMTCDDDGGPYPLIDLMTCEGKTIADGERQMVLLADEICGTLALSKAIEDIAAERRRHVEGEGWSREHDDAYQPGVLARAGAAYAIAWINSTTAVVAKRLWPLSASWWKPSSKRRDLVKAGSLIVAEIERIDRGVKS